MIKLSSVSKSFLALSIGAVALSMIGCGGSSTDTTTSTAVTGVFTDSAVAGLNYECSSGTTETTNSLGQFTCNTGDTVTFSLGEYVIGSSTVAATITPYTLYPNNTAAAVNVAQLLQTLDSDGDSSNGITVPHGFNTLDALTVALTDTSFDTEIQTFLAQTLVLETVAQDHLNDTLNLPIVSNGFTVALLEGKTFYKLQQDVSDLDNDGDQTDMIVVSMRFEFENGFEHGLASSYYLVDGTEEGSSPFAIQQDNTLIFQGSGGSLTTQIMIASDPKKLTVEVFNSPGSFPKLIYYFYNKTDIDSFIEENT